MRTYLFTGKSYVRLRIPGHNSSLVKRIFLPLILLLIGTVSRAQLQYTAAKAQVVSGTYTDLGTTGTLISTANFDNANSSAQNIGFNFFFNGTIFTTFVLNTNGFIKLGSTAPASASNFDVLTSGEANTIAPFNYNLRAGTSATEYRVATSGSSGAQVCTIQFKNVRDVATSQYNNVNFQIRLYETTNVIEFVYGTFTTSGTAAAFKEMIVGIKGSDSTASVNCQKSSADPWLTSTEFINGVYPNPARKYNNRNDQLPPSGLTFRFTPVLDLKVDAVYTLGKAPKPYGTYHPRNQVKIRNLGAYGVVGYPVALGISGANTALDTTYVTLAPKDSAIVYFHSYHVSYWNNGTNTITGSVPADDVNTNNNASYTQIVNDTLFSYADASAPIGAVGFGTNAGTVYADYSSDGGTILVTGVRVRISNNASNIGKTIYAESGAHTSAPYVIQSGDINNFVTLYLATPDTEYFNFSVGIHQAASASSYNPVAYQAEGPPCRPNTFSLYNTVTGYTSFDLGRPIIEAIVKPALVQPTISSRNILAWNFTGINSPATAPATTFSSELNSSNLLTRGPSAPPSPGENSFMTTGFKNDGISTSNSDYFQFQISVKPGDTLSLSQIYFSAWGDEDFNIYPAGVMQQFAYSLDGINFTLIGSPQNSQGGSNYFSLDEISTLQNIPSGVTVTFRYYASGCNATGAWGFQSGLGLEVFGNVWSHKIIVNPVVPMGADYDLATCSSTATGSVGFTSVGTFPTGNVYVAKMNNSIWLRDTLPVTIGSLASTANSGTINITIPSIAREGTHRIWIESTTAPAALLISSPDFAVTHSTPCQATYQFQFFRSKQSGNWNDTSTWEISPAMNSGIWYPSTVIPDIGAYHVEIRETDTVTITTPVDIHWLIVDGKLKLLNGAGNTGSLTFYENFEDSPIRDFKTTMYVYGEFQIVSSAIFDSVIRVSPTYLRQGDNQALMRVYGKITIGDGSATTGAGFHKFATMGPRIRFLNEAVFEWNSTSLNGPASNVIYFANMSSHPTFRLTKMPPGTFGSSDSTVINGILEVNTRVTMDGSGKKIFVDGITGTDTLRQNPGSGAFETIAEYQVVPPTDGNTQSATVGIMDRTIVIDLNTQGMTLRGGITIPDTGDVRLIGAGISYGKIEVQNGGRLTVDPASVLTINNADLVNNGTIEGTGKIQFTGSDTSLLHSPGIINAKIELSAKQLRLDGNATTMSIDLLGGSHLRLDSFDLNMRTGSLLADNANFVVTNDTGNLIRNVGASDVVFAIGANESSYTPVTINNAGVQDGFMARVAPGVQLNGTSITTGNVNRTWFISDVLPGGSNVKLKMQWRTPDEQTGLDHSSVRIAHGSLCPPPINCSISYFDYAPPSVATDLGSNTYAVERSGINNFLTDAFIVTSAPYLYTFTGSGDWNNVNNWTPGIIPPDIIPAGAEVVINHSTVPGSECFHAGNITVATGGKLTILPGKKFRLAH